MRAVVELLRGNDACMPNSITQGRENENWKY